ncbi:molybdopterin-binding protein [Thiohalomonas denitrificans]|uniref:Oxidoreductase molybdopterin binding domain-containing protein n=1 Tax=Thiohalomonas denitrificans TaxID=415747 RepID=A0A1G5QY90_9GAMM|nr:molybdopterin-binding protein [Thiohalomonas denitrificans]SCZ66687.1 Oxidoreductase molybdopterin binding domain-containing protein [Thiohalomonas denitrificans]
MKKARSTGGRRRFLRHMGGLSLLPLLSGCDGLSRTEWFPRLLARAETLNERLHHLLASRTSMAREFTEADLSPRFPSNGTRFPIDTDYRQLAAAGFAPWRLEVGGLVERPIRLSLEQLRAMPARTQITRHDCVEGWSAIAKWRGVRLAALLELVRPRPEARYVVFYCFDTMEPSGAKYYESIDFEEAYHPQTLLAYDWNDESLPVPYGAPLRLRAERQLGYKMAKYIDRIELVEKLGEIRGGKGGYWEDRGYEWYTGI